MNTARALTAEEHRAFRLARLVAAETAPYFMHALFAVTPLAAPQLGTLAVDAAWRLYLDPGLLIGPGAWTPATVAAVLQHEVGHLLRDHAGRAAALPQPYRHVAWNYAGDAEINDDLIAAGIALPEGVVTPAALGLDDGDLAETYYAALTANTTGPNDPHDDAGCGSGAGCPPVPGELPADAANVPAVDPAEGDLIRRRVAADVLGHAPQLGRGTLPAGLTRWASDVLAAPTIPWQRVLRATVRRAVAARTGRNDYTYSRPSRRQIPGIITPAMRGTKARVTIVVDTSGSMSQRDLDAAMGEVTGVLRATGVDREHLRILACDAHHTAPQRIRSARTVTLRGGGGTDMRVGIDAALSTRPGPHLIIVLTDGYTPWPDQPVAARLICAVIRPSEPTDTPAWATTVHIPT